MTFPSEMILDLCRNGLIRVPIRLLHIRDGGSDLYVGIGVASEDSDQEEYDLVVT